MDMNLLVAEKKEVWKTFIIIFLTLFSISFVSSQLADSSWPTFHGNSQRTGLSPYDTSHVDGTIKWKFKAGGGIEGSPSIDEDGTIYFGSHDGYLYAITEDGNLKWKTQIGTPAKVKDYESIKSTISTPSINKDGIIYILSHNQHLYAVTRDGSIKWKLPIILNTDNWGSPAIGNDGTIYITTYKPKGGLYAINPDGTEKWHYGENFMTCNSASIGKDNIIYASFQLGFNDFEIMAFSPDGNKKWGLKTPLFLESTPAIADDGTIYIGSFSETGTGAGVYAISSDGKEKWHFATQYKEIMSTPAIGKDGTMYFGSESHDFYALNQDGTLKWTFETNGSVVSSPAIGADGTIYVGVGAFGTGQPGFYAFNPDGTIKWSSLIDRSIDSSPAIGSDGTVYVTSWDNHLHAFGGPREEVPDYFKDEEGDKKGFFARIVDWLRRLFRKNS